MRLLAFGVAGLLLGVAIGWFIAPRPPRQHFFRVEHEVTLLNVEGAQVGLIPPGSFLVSECDSDPRGELGWWGYVPVYFGTQTEAARFVVPSAHGVESVTQITLSGGSRDEIVTPQPTPAPQ
jgi:hypothetical protein